MRKKKNLKPRKPDTHDV